jgi:cytochrome c-type biogenesis protein CcmF
MLRIWNVTLVILTFLLTIFATFMTRSGMVQSVHAFGEDPQLAMMFTVFMVGMAALSFGYVIYRMPLLKARNEFDSWLSREAAFLANNWILLFSAVFILFATMFPTLSESVRGERLTVGPPFYNKWMLPIGLALLLLTGIGPLLAWRKSTVANLKDQFMWPVLSSLVVTVTMLALGVRVWTSGICFALSGFTVGTITQEFIRGARVRQTATGTDIFTAFVGLFARSRRRYAGYTVHLGIVLIFLGFAGEGFKQEEQLVLKPGQSMTIGAFTVRQDAIRVTDDGQKQMVTSHMTVSRGGQTVGEMLPGKWFYRKHEDQPTTEVAIRRGFAEDLYIVLAGFEVETQAATLHIVVNPLVNWIWLGFGVLAFGTLITLMPERAFNFATSKIPAGAASATSTTMLTIALLVMPLMQPYVHAQHSEDVTGAYLAPKTAFEREMQDEIICMCRGCGRKRLGECLCPLAGTMRGELSKLVAAGQTREEIYQYFMDKWDGQEPLASPIDKGFNRLAWAFPYALGGIGAFGAVMLAFKWSKQSRLSLAGAGAGAGAMSGAMNDVAAVDPRLQERLSDELRDLD